MSHLTIEQVIRGYFDGVNAERYDDVGALFAPDGTLSAPGTDELRGGSQIATYFAAALRLYPEHDDQPTRTVIAGRTALVEIHYTGRLASGTVIEFDAVDVFDFDAEHRIVRLTSWYDSHLVRQMLRADLAAATSDAA